MFLKNRLNVPYESVLINYCTIFSITLLASCKAAFMTLKINLAGQKSQNGRKLRFLLFPSRQNNKSKTCGNMKS